MLDTAIQPYLFFGGRCEEALEFYRSALGAKVEMLMRHRDNPEPPPPGVLAAGVLVAALRHAHRSLRHRLDGRRLRRATQVRSAFG